MTIGKINQYRCNSCGGLITTIDRAEGVTPFMLNCRTTEGCNGSMFSAMYRVNQTLTPNYEWYKPDKLPKDRGMREHVKMGGLMLRAIVQVK